MYVAPDTIDEEYERLSDPERFEKEVLIKTTFIEECKQLPLEHLNKRERKLVNKCINKNPMKDEEVESLRELLGKYRPAIDKYKPEETLKNIDTAKELIETEAEFIRLMQQNYKEVTLDVNFNGEYTRPLNFVIHPITDSTAYLDIIQHLNLLEDFNSKISEKDKKLMSKEKDELNEYELQILEKLNDEADKKLAADGLVETLLISSVTLKGQDASLETREKFWSVMPVGTKMTLFYLVLDFNGIIGDFNSKLFQP